MNGVRLGLLGVATHLPPIRRTNDWWPQATVRRWAQTPRTPPPLADGEPTPAMARVLAAVAEQQYDPFQGVTERRILPDDMSPLDLEFRAAELAIERSGIDRREIDLVLVNSTVPDYLVTNTACGLHQELGLAPACLTLQVGAAAYSFIAQLAMVEHMIATGSVRYALLVQSSAASRLLDPDDPDSPVFGDGAAAQVVGPAMSEGLLSTVHRTDGTELRSLVASVRGGRWYDDGRIVLHRADPEALARVFLLIADRATKVVGEALERAGVASADVDFFAVHQGTTWLRQVCQESIGLTRAHSLDTIATTGHVFGASIPLVLETAQRQGLVGRDNVVVLFGGGTGSTYGAAVIRWGDPVA